MPKAANQTSAPAPDNIDGPAHARTALLYQLLETEMGGVQVYRTALLCVINPDLRVEWAKYLAQTERHVVVARDLLTKLGLDPDAELPARLLCRHDAQGLIKLMLEAAAAGTPGDAELTAAECVVKAETKDHMNWSLLGLVAKATTGADGDAIRAAHAEVEKEEDHHLYHSTGWARELWAKALGVPAALPPPEEQRDVDSALEAAEAKEDRDGMVKDQPKDATKDAANDPSKGATKAGVR